MIPVTQTKIVIKNSKDEFVQRGNCFAACVASIMELPITEVPNVEVFYHLDTGYAQEVIMTFLESKGWELMTDERFLLFHCGWEHIDNINCQHEKNYQRVLELMPDHDKRDIIKYELKDKYYFASGKSARGVSHICIFKNGKLIHDPHPTKEGLQTIEYFETLEKKS